MRRDFLKGTCLKVAFWLCCLLVLGPPAQVGATTVCDTDPASVRYQPTADPVLLNNLLNMLGGIPVNYTFDTSIRLLYSHTLHLTVRSSINLAGTDFAVTPALGSIRAQLYLPAWSANMVTSVSHAACRNCAAEYNACVNYCISHPSLPCFGWDLCCQGECVPARTACEADALACSTEAAAINALLSGHTAGLSFSSATVTQVADVCVTGDCTAVHPLEYTNAVLSGFRLTLFPTGDPLGIGSWLNGIITNLVNWAVDIPATIRNFFVDDAGGGLLINALSFDIKNDGCMPVQPVLDCMNTGCSTVDQSRRTFGRSVNVVFYALPVAILLGLILLSRKRAG